MPIKINGQIYYRTAEACKMVGVSKNSVLRWIKEKTFVDVENRDRRGWRLFTENDVLRLKAEVHKVSKSGGSVMQRTDSQTVSRWDRHGGK